MWIVFMVGVVVCVHSETILFFTPNYFFFHIGCYRVFTTLSTVFTQEIIERIWASSFVSMVSVFKSFLIFSHE